MSELKHNIHIPISNPRQMREVALGQVRVLEALRKVPGPNQRQLVEQAEVNVNELLDRWPLGKHRPDIDLAEAHRIGQECVVRALLEELEVPVEA